MPMHYRFPLGTFLRLKVAIVAMAAGLVPVHAGDASGWATNTHSKVRLIAGTNSPGQPVLRAGLDIMLAPGWKTYWRYPGDSGVPPQFDFAASRNVKAVNVLWPAPSRMADGGGQSIGYHDRVVMPLRVVLKDPSQPALLHLKLSYAVCEKLCVPAEASAQMTLAPAVSANDAVLAAAEARVPRPASIGDAGAVAVRQVRREDGGGKPRVVVEVAAPKDVPVDLFVEGPTPEWALPLPAPNASSPPGSRQFSFELDGLPAGAQPKGAVITFTLVTAAEAIEVKTRLD